jgi:hypothetical protein
MKLQEQISRIKLMMGVVKEDDLTLSDLGKRDQEVRNMDNNFDLNIDFENQKQLKNIIGNNPQEFINKITDIKDLENIWVVTQHADNDIEFQKMILDLFINNKDRFIETFPEQEQMIKQGIAMLTDRVMVNDSINVDIIKHKGKDNFSDISKGVQKYGTQGGDYNRKWVPRPIEMNGQLYFFKTPEELYSNKEFLSKINSLRSDSGLPPLDDYVNKMQKFI